MKQSVIYKGHLIRVRKSASPPFDYYGIVYSDDGNGSVLGYSWRDDEVTSDPAVAMDLAKYDFDNDSLTATKWKTFPLSARALAAKEAK